MTIQATPIHANQEGPHNMDTFTVQDRPNPQFFSQQSRSRIQDLSFLAFTHSFRGPQKQESRNNHNSSILEQKIKQGIIFYEKN